MIPIGSITIDPRKAVELLHCEMDRATLEAWIRQGNCPFGVFVKKEGKQRGHYVIFRERLEAYISAQDLKAVG